MEFFKPGVRFDFLRVSKTFLTVSAVMVLASWALVGVRGLNYGIDFAGGTEALAAFERPVDVATVRKIADQIGLDKPEVVTFGIVDEGRYFVRSRSQGLFTTAEKKAVREAIEGKVGTPARYDDSDESGEEIRVTWADAKSIDEIKAAALTSGLEGIEVTPAILGSETDFIVHVPGVRKRLADALIAEFGKQGEGDGAFVSIERLESVGAAVGEQMRNNGILAVLYSMIGILLYVSFRFDLRYSPGAVIALVHDVSITIGIFSILQLEFSLPIIAALLAIVGYSLNDTIVVFDRIREMLKLGVGEDLVETINISLSDCLSRTVLTSVTTFFAVLSIWVFGGGIVENFAFAMLIGVVVGTYSSIYIASPAMLAMDRYLSSRKAATVEATKPRRRSRAARSRPS